MIKNNVKARRKELGMTSEKDVVTDYRNKPNLMRVVIELATYENPYEVTDYLLIFVKGSMNNFGDGN